MEFCTEEYIVEIDNIVFSVFRKYEQVPGRNESGGILLGGFIPEEKKYVITVASAPSPKDKQGITFFVRHKESAQEIINTWWAQSAGKINYLGEWHTHGCKWPRPSFTDKQLLKSIAKDKSNVWPLFFMIIVGQHNTYYLGIADSRRRGKLIREFCFLGRE